MAYNPFDDVIDQDPAYMANGGQTYRAGQGYQQVMDQPAVQDEILQGSQTMANIARGPINLVGDVFAQTLGRIAENMVNPEAAERGKRKKAIRDEAHRMFGVVPAQMTPDMIRLYEQETGNKYEQLTFEEGINSGLNFFLEDAIAGSKAIQQGARFTELPGAQQLGVGLLPLEFWLGGGGARRAGQEIGESLVQKYKDMPMGELVANPQAREEIPEVVAQIEREYPVLQVSRPRQLETTEDFSLKTPSGMDLTLSQMEAADQRGMRFLSGKPGGSGLASSTPNISTKIKNYLDKVDKPKTVAQVADATGLTKRQIRNFKYESTAEYRNKILPDTQTGTHDFLLDYFKKNPNQVFPNRRVFEDKGISRETIYQFITKYPQYRKNFMNSFQSSLSNRLKKGIEKLKSMEEKKIPTKDLAKIFGYENQGNLKRLLDKKNPVKDGLITQDELDYINSFRTNLSGPQLEKIQRTEKLKQDLINNPDLQNLGNLETSRTFKTSLADLEFDMRKDPELYALVAKDQKLIGSTDELKSSAIRKALGPEFDLIDYSILNNLYRGVKDIEGYTPEQFLTLFKKQNPNLKKTLAYKKTRKAYQELENERVKLQKEAYDFFDKKRKDPRYQKYLKESDRKQFVFDKAHAFFISDATQQDRFLNMAQMSDLIFNTPTTSNLRLQKRFDKPARIIASLTDSESLKLLENTPVNASAAEFDRRFRLNIPEIIQRLEEYGIQIYPEDYKNLKELIFGKGGIKEGIEKAYKDQGVGTLVPVGEEKIALVGKNPKKVSARQRLNMLKKRFQKILDDQILYEKTNGKKGKKIMRQGGDETEGGFILGLQDGGEVKPVRMAIGGDPLQNLNQQQFSPDPAFEGEDYFQEAVDSGNLQAVNLFNLFKVFKKPKVMATPSNVKQVEQARDPMPQGVPGSQELQPLPAGKPDFFFKSYLLDQLNSPNAPKASNPQGWREFLIKGKKVPEAEMLDTGILQYLEDTEKFYPNKKITKQEIEDLYDMSPLGNLEVRVKPVRGYPEGENVPQESFEFFADQGTQKHRGVGSASIDESMDTYFEVVVNVPSLPGQERAYVNSAHFSEPNVLGFTRVGTYKNNKGETVAVIQEMQTDMLTEVRKEQERLFAMVNALKRERAKLVDQAQNSANPDYYKNELRLFDQKYPPGRLDALETNTLIQPFPNIVAKDLIPERTASLNSIQEQINKLMMANVEQYNDPAYKTMVFDLAQQQNKIFEDLSSMNRTANYEETLKDFKVPATGERDELERIAYRDEYLPSSYNLKQVQSFPPIPFNKQADYVDLLLKSTIKAAKGKGIDKVAIMPADVGANPRWRKDTDEAKKKFQNLYDKVGVQQLKNIAKKYGGKLEIEKIIDKNKTTRGLTFLNKNPDGEFQILKQTETRKEISDADRDKYYDEEITRIASGVTEPGDVVLTREIAPGQMMDYYVVEGRGDATDVGYRMIPLKDGESADDAMIKIVEYNPSEVDMYTISFDPSKLEEPMYLFKKKSGGTIDKDSLVSITDIYGEYGR